MSEPGRFTVIIPHRNGADLLLSALAALKAAWDPVRDRVIVVDNASTDDSVARLQAAHPDVQVIRNPCNNGFGRACNQALALAESAYALILNNDARLGPGTLDRFEAFFQSHPDAAILAPQLFGPKGEPQRSYGWHPDFVSETGLGRKRKARVEGTEPRPVETVVGACMAVRMQAVAACGGFDEDFFFYFEETEWCLRMQRAGWSVWLIPELKVVHGKGESTRPLRTAAQIEMLRSRLIYYRKAFGEPAATFLAAWRVLRLLLNTVISSIGVVATLGFSGGLRNKAGNYLKQSAWLLVGCPEHWGLPDKCPRGLGQRGR